jgi:D-ribose pyranase
MKSGRLLNSELSAVIARMGHTDSLVIADAGLPVPVGPMRIDLALTRGIPSFLATFETILEELRIERILLAEEIRTRNSAQLDDIMKTLSAYRDRTGALVEIVFVPHEAFKQRTGAALAIVRTGECTPYSNVILHSGVVF